ncbi:hypothetical protein MTO96_007672 [Rhipicephalus appendiculatus]
MSIPDVPDLRYVIHQLGRTLYVNWKPPKDCFKICNFTISYNTDHCTESEGVSFGSCVGTTLVDCTQPRIVCTDMPPCGSANVTFTAQHSGNQASTSVGRTTTVLLSEAAIGITNLSLLAADNRYVTVTWDRPHGNFDFYLLDVTVGSGNITNAVRKPPSGFCANGTIISAEETQVTCGPFEACSSIDITVRTFSKGPPGTNIGGSTLKDVFIGGQDPNEPHSITMVSKTPHTTRMLWEPPTSVDGILDVYNVKVCEKSTTCDEPRKPDRLR